jgi:hypothetical protein
VVKVKDAKKHPSGAKAHCFLPGIYGTAEAVPFQILPFATCCLIVWDFALPLAAKRCRCCSLENVAYS